MNLKFRLAEIEDLDGIWEIIDKAILRRKEDGSNQWQDGYPNLEIIKKDMAKKAAHVLTNNNELVAYCSLTINNEVEYEKIIGKWLSNTDYVVFHRLAVSEKYLGKGISTKCFEHIHDFAKSKNIKSVKADTNFDNKPMLYLFNKMGYVHCGKVYFRGSERLAFEKLLEY